MDFLPPFDKALKDICLTLQNPLKERIDDKPFYIGLEGAFGEHQVRCGHLNASHIGQLISIEGIVARCKFTFFGDRRVERKEPLRLFTHLLWLPI
jgi:DNA replication licensing factor MCM3